MAKFYGWKETIFSFLIFGENVLLIGLSNAMMVINFLSGINLFSFLPLNPAIYRIGNAPNILCPRCKEVSPHYIANCKLSKVILDFISELI